MREWRRDLVRLGGKYWVHEPDCGVLFAHVHYGQNVVLRLDDARIPERIRDEYHRLFGNPDVDLETTDAPPYQTTALLPKPPPRVILADYPGFDPT